MSQVINIAHRGARSLAPENTLVAAKKGLEIGADLWETDVQVTVDGELVLMHDDTLVRTSNAVKKFPNRAPWSVGAFTLADLKKLDCGSWFIEGDPFGQIDSGAVTPGELLEFTCAAIPTVREALLFTQDNDWRVNLEIKHLNPPLDKFPIVEKLLALIDEYKIDQDRLILSSFNHEYLRQIRRSRPDMVVQALVGDLPVSPDNCTFQTYNAWSGMAGEQRIREFVARGFSINIYTVNSFEDMQRFIAAGVSGIFTDFPQRLKELIANQ